MITKGVGLRKPTLYFLKVERWSGMKKNEIEDYCTRLVTPIIEENSFELVDVEYVKEGADYYLRVYADKEGGINIDDCVLISRALEKKLDEEDKIESAYILEVSSPGLTRPLKKDKDFKRSIGRKVDIKLYNKINGLKQFTAELKAYTEQEITVLYETEELIINKKDISMIRLAFE